MKINWNYIKAFVLAIVLVFLFSFAENRNAKRELKDIHVEYVNKKDIYITPETVNNLLIVNKEAPGKRTKDSLNLNDLEVKLNLNPMIARAEVFQTITKDLGVHIVQHEPIARVIGDKSFYIEKSGGVMPLSTNHSARVPILMGLDSTDIAQVYPLLTQIQEDKFLEKHITGIAKSKKGDYVFNLRNSRVKVVLGSVENLESKIINFKAFYIKANKEELLDKYSEINLKYSNQVVCTKKEA